MAKVETKSIDDILPDPNNANKHTQRGHQLVENSIRRRGVGRGILAAGKNTDKPVIMAGNLTHEKARDAGIDEVVFVHTTGNQLVVTVRDDLDPTSPEAIALGIEDNETAKQSYSPDIDLLAAMSAGDNGVLSALKAEDKIFAGMLEGMFPVDYLGKEEKEEKNKAEKIKGNVDLIYTAGTYGENNALTHCCLAVKSGWLYGYQSKDNPCATHKIQDAHKPSFIDNNYFDFQWDRHLDAVKTHKPKYCTVMDIMTKEQCQESGVVFHEFNQILEWAEELSQYAQNVIVIPKYDCINAIPEKFMLGYSVPTSHGGTPLPIQAFNGRRVHLLGGSPNKQIQFFERIPESVISLDNNYILKIANYGVAWCPDGKQRSLTDLGFGMVNNPLYVALAISLGNFAGYFRKASIDGMVSNDTFSEDE